MESWLNAILGLAGLGIGCFLAFSGEPPSQLGWWKTLVRLCWVPLVPAVLCAVLQGVLLLLALLPGFAGLPSLLVSAHFFPAVAHAVIKEREHSTSHYLENRLTRLL